MAEAQIGARRVVPARVRYQRRPDVLGFVGWKIITDEIVEDVADWDLRKGKVARFTAQKP